MPDWDDLRKLAESEAADLAEGLRGARDRLDSHLAKKEAEMAATPKERMDMILDDIEDHNAATEALLTEADSTTDEAADRPDGDEAQPSPRDSIAAEGVEVEAEAEIEADVEPAEIEPADVGSVVGSESSPPAVADSEASLDTDTTNGVSQEPKPKPKPVSQLHVEYERRKADADDLLDELRGELGIEPNDG